jgi:voltage-gated potassium channel
VPFFLFRVIRGLSRRRAWALPATLSGFVFVTSWPLMWLAEGTDAPIVQPDRYWWYFVVTSATVGYGDLFPATTAGRAVGVYVIVGGIGTLTALFAQLSLAIERTRGRRMKGTAQVEATGHIVVLGYLAGRTERLVDELLADGARSVVLCAWDEVDAHPLADREIGFVRGDLTDASVLRRAAIDKAAGILVDARNDNESLAVLVTVDHVAPRVHVVVALRDLSRATNLNYVSSNVRCVQWHNPRMLTEELASPGISDVYSELMTSGGPNTYSAEMPSLNRPVTFGDCQTALGRRFNATLLAVRTPLELLVNPAWSTPVPVGAYLYYVCTDRLSSDQIGDAIKAAGKAAAKV